MHKIIFTSFLCVAVLWQLPALFAQQNLVPNGSFEEYTSCPDGISQLNRVVGWTSPSLGTPDYMNTCDLSSEMGVPQNSRGNQSAHEGDAYCLLVTYASNSLFREYLQIELLNFLNPNQLYSVSFFISKADEQKYATNNMGVLLSNEELHFNHTININLEPNYNIENIIVDDQNWTEITFDYLANGIEKFIIIGNFYDDFNTIISSVPGDLQAAAYYIDDVKVEEKSINLIPEKSVSNFLTYNPESKILKIINSQIVGIKIFDLTGKFLTEIKYEDNSTINLQNEKKGLYFFQLKLSNQTILNYKFLI